MTAIPGVRRAPARLSVRVDASRCTGRGVCVELAPELFSLDRFGYAYVRPGRAVVDDGPSRALAREAAARCPAAAIVVHEATPAAAPPALVEDGYRDAGPRLLWDGDGAEPMEAWVAHGGYAAVSADELVVAVDEAGLRGHGGGRFPVARKWASLSAGPRALVVNAAEREPGTAKDRYLLERRPHLVLDGVRVTAEAIGAVRAAIGVDEDSTQAHASVTGALDEAQRTGRLGSLRVEVRSVPGRYVAGEETALLRALDGGPPLPHARPPYPTQRGWGGLPTLVHNVETVAQVALVAANGARWFRGAGTPGEPGTGLFSVGTFGAVPRVVERPYGYPLSRLLSDEGLTGHAVVVGGWAGGMLPGGVDVPLTASALEAQGACLGTKSVQVVPAGTCPVGVAARVVGFFGDESAGQCPPCRDGLPYVAEVLRSLERGTAEADQLAEARSFLETLPRRGACSLPDGAVRFARSLFRHFPDLVEGHLASGCGARG